MIRCANSKRIFQKGRKYLLLLNYCLLIFRAHLRGLSSLVMARHTQVTVIIREATCTSRGLVSPGKAEVCVLWGQGGGGGRFPWGLAGSQLRVTSVNGLFNSRTQTEL